MELKVWIGSVQRVISGVSESTTSQQVILALAQATGTTGRFTLVEKWRDYEKTLTPSDCPLVSAQQFGNYAHEVQFILQQTGDSGSKQSRRLAEAKSPKLQRKRGGIKKSFSFSGGPQSNGSGSKASPAHASIPEESLSPQPPHTPTSIDQSHCERKGFRPIKQPDEEYPRRQTHPARTSDSPRTTPRPEPYPEAPAEPHQPAGRGDRLPAGRLYSPEPSAARDGGGRDSPNTHHHHHHHHHHQHHHSKPEHRSGERRHRRGSGKSGHRVHSPSVHAPQAESPTPAHLADSDFYELPASARQPGRRQAPQSCSPDAGDEAFTRQYLELERTIANYERRLEEEKNKVLHLDQEIARVTAEEEQKWSDLYDCRDEITKALQTVQRLDAELEECDELILSEELNVLIRQQEETTLWIAETRRRLTEQDAAAAEKETAATELRRQLDEAEAAGRQKEARAADLDGEIADLEAKLAEKNRFLSEAEDGYSSARADLKEADQALEKRKQMVEELERELREYNLKSFISTGFTEKLLTTETK